ncbi:MAG: hypothetical protein EBY79_07015 [Actinobacteria bacterium]|nr:hypothetical protein [Actinomycetota bacterium]
MSYLNVYDADAAWSLVHRFTEPAAVVIKHGNPCGVAVANDIETAYRWAHECDPVSAFGGIVGLNRTMTAATAEALGEVFTEVIIAPDFEPQALEVLARKKNLRVLRAVAPLRDGRSIRSIDGGVLVQDHDTPSPDTSRWRVVSRVQPTAAQLRDAALAWVTCAAVSSNAIVLVNDSRAVGIVRRVRVALRARWPRHAATRRALRHTARARLPPLRDDDSSRRRAPLPGLPHR